MITIFKKGALVGDFRYDKEAIAIVYCDDRYTIKFINNMSKEKLMAIENKSKRWKYNVIIDWL